MTLPPDGPATRLSRMLGLPRTVRLAREIAEGRSEAHANGIVHRDLKASNLMVNGAGRSKFSISGWRRPIAGRIRTSRPPAP